MQTAKNRNDNIIPVGFSNGSIRVIVTCKLDVMGFSDQEYPHKWGPSQSLSLQEDYSWADR